MISCLIYSYFFFRLKEIYNTVAFNKTKSDIGLVLFLKKRTVIPIVVPVPKYIVIVEVPDFLQIQ